MDEKILAELSLDEYIYLTENLEVIEHGGDKKRGGVYFGA